MNAFSHSHANGLHSLLNLEGACPLVSVQCWVQTGSMNEGQYLGCGLSHLLEHMVFKGSRSYTGPEMAERVQSLGGSWNAYTSTDRTVFHIDGPASAWRDFVHLLCELVFYPSFPMEEWDREREVIRREMAMYDDDADDAAYRALTETLFLKHPRRLPVIGDISRFDALCYEDMLQYHKECYVPNRVFFCTSAGTACIDADEYVKVIDGYCGGLRAGAMPDGSRFTEPRQWGPRVTRREFAQSTSRLMLGWRVPSLDHADAPALALLASMLGDGRAAWLHGRFHDDLGLAHDVSTSLIPARNGEGEGAFLVEADCDRELRDELAEAIVTYLHEGVQQEDVAQGRVRALRQLELGRLRRLSSVKGRAAMLGISWHLTNNVNYLEEWTHALERVSLEEVRGLAQRYLASSPDCVVSVDPLGSNEPEAGDVVAEQKEDVRLLHLDNGLRVVVYPKRELPMVHATLAFGAGCACETRDDAGIGSLMAECLLKGSPSRSARDVANELENIGASVDSDAGNNTICLKGRCLSGDVAVLLDVMADGCMNASFLPEVVAQEREAMLADFLDAQQEPISLAFYELRRACFGDVAYGLSPDGSLESLQSLDADALHAYRTRVCCARNGVLSIVGDIDADEVMALVRTYFGAMEQGAAVERTPSPLQRAADVSLPCNKQQAVLTLAIPAFSVTSSQVSSLNMILEWCRDMAGPLFSEIREKRGLAYYASATGFTGIDTGVLYCYVGTSLEQLPEAREALESCLAHLASEGMDEDCFKRVRATALAAYLESMQSDALISSHLALDVLLGLGEHHLFQRSAAIEQLGYEELQSVISLLFSPSRTRTWVTVSPPAP